MKHNRKRELAIVAMALLIDAFWGDPPTRWHPVAWMGKLIDWLQKRAPTAGRLRPFLSGGGIAFGGAGLMWGIGRLLLLLPEPIRTVVETAVLAITFSLRGLIRAGEDVEQALQADDLPMARHWLGWHLVSRATDQLNESQIAAATIESLAENLSDGVIAPLFFYRLGGLPAATAYRYVNTCDAMLGYRDAAREWLGKIPARLDDLLNIVPSRLTAAGILGASLSQRRVNWHTPLAIYWRDKQQTDSPNAGQPMSAMAGALGVELEKVDQYCLGKGQRAPQTADIRRAIRVVYGASFVALGLLFLWRRDR